MQPCLHTTTKLTICSIEVTSHMIYYPQMLIIEMNRSTTQMCNTAVRNVSSNDNYKTNQYLINQIIKKISRQQGLNIINFKK